MEFESAQSSNFMEIKYLGRDHLVGFENYKYSAVDTSPLSRYVTHPFWNNVVKICPRTIAPNVLTFVGFMMTTSNFLVLTYYDYHYYAASSVPPGDQYPPIPRWVWWLLALFHFLAHTLDGIDGKQARRTNTSGPLGELFDHGLDAWTAFFIPGVLWSVFGRLDHSISPLRFYFVLCNVLVCFYTSHWEKYITKVLFLPWGYDLSQLTILLIYIVTGACGTEVWKFTLLGIPSGAWAEIMMYSGSLVSGLPMSFYNVYASYRDGTGKMLSLGEAMRPLVCPGALFLATTVWALASPSDLLQKDPRMFSYLLGALFANINCRLIVSQMSGTRCEAWHWSLWALPAATALSLAAPHLEMTLLVAMTTAATLAHLHYGVCVVRQMCSHFNIRCFSIKDRQD